MNSHFERALVLRDAGRSDKAMRELRAGLARNPEHALGWATLAAFLNDLNQRQEALHAIVEALRLDPADAHFHYVLGVIRADRGEPAEAMAAAVESIRLAPDEAQHHALLSRLHMSRAAWTEALGAAHDGLGLDPENMACLFHRSTILAKLGRHEESRDTLATLTRLHPDHPVSHHALGCSLVEQGDFVGARRHFLEALRVDPGDDDARRGLALCLRARHTLYGLAVRSLLWLDRFSTGRQWTLLIAALLLTLTLDRTLPHLAPLWVFVKAAWWVVAVGTVLTGPLFNLILRLDPAGRQVLSSSEIRASNWHLPVIAASAALGIGASRTGVLWFAWALAILSLAPWVTEHFEARSPWVRRRLRWVALGILLSLPASLGLILLAALLPTPFLRPSFVLAPLLPVLASFGGFYSDDLRCWLERRGPDDAPPGTGR